VLVVAALDEHLAAIGEEIPDDRYAPLAARSWASVEAFLGDRPLAAAVIHYKLADVGAIEFARRLRARPGLAELPIVLLLPSVGRAAQPGEPFDIAIRFPCGPGVLADNLAKVMAASDEAVRAAVDDLKVELGQRLVGIDKKTYYEVLDVDREARRDEIIDAYDRFSLRFHPDRIKYHLAAEDAQTQEQARNFYLLVTEAYQTLLDPAKRKRYDRELKAGRLRFDPSLYQTIDDLSKVTNVENAKRYLRLAQKELDRGDKAAASVFFKMAQAVDPENDEIRQRLEDLEGGG
jgi:hypothetical protein